jgi:hypothetical protein
MGLTWVLALAATLWMALGTASVAAWTAVAFIGLVPPVVAMILANTPATTMAAVIRDVEAGRRP